MAQSGLTIPAIADVAGVKAWTVDTMLRELRPEGLAPTGARGRGQLHGQFEPHHLAALILAFAGPPGHAAIAARSLYSLVYLESNSAADSPYVEGTTTLGEALEAMIQGVAQGMSELPGSGPEKTLPIGIDVCLAPIGAQLRWEAANGSSGTDRYGLLPGSVSRLYCGAITRTTTIHPDILFKAGELWSDSLKHRPELVLSGHRTDSASAGAARATGGQREHLNIGGRKSSADRDRRGGGYGKIAQHAFHLRPSHASRDESGRHEGEAGA